MKANQCGHCYRFCTYEEMDSYTPFGHAGMTEPYDPTYICAKCAKELKDEFIKKFKNGGRFGDWQKSNAEIGAAKLCGLVWVVGEYRYKSLEPENA